MTRPDHPAPSGGTDVPGTDPVRIALAALGPVPMPDDVASRIRSRLAVETMAATGEHTTRAGTGGPGTEGVRPREPGTTSVGPGTPGTANSGTGDIRTRDPGTGSARPAAPGTTGTASRGRTGRRSVPRAPRPTGPGPHRRFRPVRAGLGLAVAAAAAVLVAVPVFTRPTGPEPIGSDGPLADELRTAATTLGGPEGPLADPAYRRGCLAAAGAAGPDAPLVAAGPHPVGGRPGLLLVLATPERGVFRLLVVDAGCRPGRGELLAELPVVR